LTLRTAEYPLRQGHTLPISALWIAACLRCIGWIHQDHFPTGPFCLVGQVLDELIPGCILNAFSQTMILEHVIDGQVLNSYEPMPVHDLS